MIVDANAHASLDGTWFGTDADAGLDRLLAELDAARVDQAVLTGIVGAASTDDVLELAGRAGGRLLPVGALDPSVFASEADAREGVRALCDRGLVGVKLHPRLGRYDLLDARAVAALDELASWDRPPAVWICTFLHVPGLRAQPPVEALCEVVGRRPDLRFVLAHGGGPDLLRLATAVRSAPNAVLDLSYTLTHFSTSSVWFDVQHLLTTFDRRLVFGSDFPEVSIVEARATADRLLADAPDDVRARVMGGNLVEFLGL